jgi:hypothetical protein
MVRGAIAKFIKITLRKLGPGVVNNGRFIHLSLVNKNLWRHGFAWRAGSSY